MKQRAKLCPFCGAVPTGGRFCTTSHGPALICDDCGAVGPTALDVIYIQMGRRYERRLEKTAIRRWNTRHR